MKILIIEEFKHELDSLRNEVIRNKIAQSWESFKTGDADILCSLL